MSPLPADAEGCYASIAVEHLGDPCVTFGSMGKQTFGPSKLRVDGKVSATLRRRFLAHACTVQWLEN